MEAQKDKFHHANDTAREAFDELCAMVENFLGEREERRAAAMTRLQALRRYNARQHEKHQKLRRQYLALLDQYNALASEVKNRSDSSSSEESEKDDNCCIM